MTSLLLVTPNVNTSDRRGWRLFSKSDLDRLKAEANQINKLSNVEAWGGGQSASTRFEVKNEKC